MQPSKPNASNGQRVRAGLTGLAAIFLIVMAAAAGLRPAKPPVSAAHGDPLAVLGVAPGSGTDASLRRQSRLDTAQPTRQPART